MNRRRFSSADAGCWEVFHHLPPALRTAIIAKKQLMRFRHLLPLAAVAAVLTSAGSAEAVITATDTFKFQVGTTFSGTGAYWSGGHGDIDMHEHAPGDWEVHYHFHSEPDPNNPSQPEDSPSGGNGFPGNPELHEGEFEWKYEAADLTTYINSSLPAAQRTRDAGAQWDFTGVTSGSTFYVLPASEVAGLPFLGFSAEGKPFDITFSLGAVTGGVISAWTEDGVGNPTPYWSSSTPGANGGFTVPAGGHAHMFIGFSQQGNYTAQITAVPEPGSFVLAAIGGLGLAGFAAVRRRRRA